jgi:hypothetical protein
VVAVQQATESLVNDDTTVGAGALAVDELVAETLVRTLGVIVGRVFAKDALEVRLAGESSDRGTRS